MTGVTGSARLIRFILRVDRIRLAVWIVAITLMSIASAASLSAVYPDQEAIETYIRLFGDNPALVAFAGPGYGFEDPNLGLVLVNETQLNAMIAIALMSIFLVNRHTRAEEESERADLLRANVVGRHAPATAAAMVIGSANILIGVMCTLGFIALDYEVAGSVALGASMAVVGLVFAGITALTAQVVGSGRTTLGIASAVLGASFAIRAIGDVADNGLSWLSPIGWAQAIRAFAGERWWTVGLCLLVAATLMAAAFWLSTRRDLGSGLVPEKPGEARARRWMSNPIGFAFRLHRGALLGWATALFFLGFVYGSIADDIDELIAENPFAEEMFAAQGGATLTDQFLAAGIGQLALIAAACGIATTLRMATEEAARRAEPLLAAPVARWRWAGSHLAMAAGGSFVGLAFAGLGCGLAYGLVIGDAGQIPRLIAAALAGYPAVLVLTSVAYVFFGKLPSVARAAWFGFALCVVVGAFGELFRLPDWTLGISPFEHLPSVPAEDPALAPVVVLVALTVVAIAFGTRSFSTRDLRTD